MLLIVLILNDLANLATLEAPLINTRFALDHITDRWPASAATTTGCLNKHEIVASFRASSVVVRLSSIPLDSDPVLRATL